MEALDHVIPEAADFTSQDRLHFGLTVQRDGIERLDPIQIANALE